MHLALLAHSFAQDYGRMLVYFETCFPQQPEYYATIVGSRLASLWKLHAEAALLYLELGHTDSAIEQLSFMAHLLTVHHAGDQSLVEDVRNRVYLINKATP